MLMFAADRGGPSGTAAYHAPVMLQRAVELLGVKPGGRYCDGTLGGGGHAAEILRRSAPDGVLLGIDRDDDALTRCAESLGRFGDRAILARGSFGHVLDIAEERGLLPLDGILVDLGVSSHQLDTASRGFSFDKDGPLDMRLGRGGGLTTAGELIRLLPEAELARTISRLGEERKARRVARAIKQALGRDELHGTLDLARVVSRAVGGRGKSKINPATRTFQALRMAVNDELGALEALLHSAPDALRPGGRIAVIAFHSLEDRAVKQGFARLASPCTCPPDLPVCGCGLEPKVKLLTPRPARPDEDEVARNPRSRSAKLRAAEML